jgi:hypothetical protein
MLVVQHHGTQTPISYNHVINPIKVGKHTEPNWDELKKIRNKSACNILDKDFEKTQKDGHIVIINRAGGWCIITYSMDILEGKELIK